MLCCNLDVIKVRYKMQVDVLTVIIFCYLSDVDAMRVIPMLVVK